MKRVAIASLLLLMTVPAVLAQDKKPENDATQTSIELNHLFVQAGRAWGHRVIHWTRGESPQVETTKSNVKEFADGVAEVTSETRDFDGDSVGSTTALITVDEVGDASKAMVAESLPIETLDMGFRAFPCRKLEVKGDGMQVTTWTSTEFHPLVVKQVTFRGEYTEIRKLTSFNSAETDPWLLYRMVGRRFKIKMTGPDEVFFSECTVVGCDDEGADLEVTKSDADGNIEGETKSERVEFTRRLKLVVPEGVDEVKSIGEEVVTVPAGEFDCYIVELGKIKLYFSNTWSELPVKLESETGTIELVEFDLGHDFMKFYRTAGNTYTTKSTTKFQAMNIESSVTYKVKKYVDGVSTYVMTGKDANGRQTFKNEMSLDVSEPDGQLLPYFDQVEELIETPAGKFPAIRTQMEETTTWMWHGIVVRMEMKMDDIEMTQELTELKME